MTRLLTSRPEWEPSVADIAFALSLEAPAAPMPVAAARAVGPSVAPWVLMPSGDVLPLDWIVERLLVEVTISGLLVQYAAALPTRGVAWEPIELAGWRAAWSADVRGLVASEPAGREVVGQ
jgi:hypothetical protein